MDRWEEARALCAEPAEACSARLRADFGVESFERDDNILEALRFVVVWDLGAWPPPEDDFVHAASVEPFADWPGEATTAKVYNYAAVAVERIVLDDERTTAQGHFGLFLDGVMYVSSPLTSFSAASVAPSLVHEAAHATWGGHDACGGGPCDRSWAGAYGAQAAVAALAAGNAEGMDALALRNAAEDAAEHVVEE